MELKAQILALTEKGKEKSKTGMGVNVDKCTNFYGLKYLSHPMTLLTITLIVIKMLIGPN